MNPPYNYLDDFDVIWAGVGDLLPDRPTRPLPDWLIDDLDNRKGRSGRKPKSQVAKEKETQDGETS